MNNKLHLLYGIIIGILLCACIGANKSDSSPEKKYKHVAVYRAYYPDDPDSKQYMISGPNDSFLQDALKGGYEVLDFEYDDDGKPRFLLAHTEEYPSASTKD